MAYGWQGEHVRLVPLDRDRHFENALLWLNDPTVTEWTLIGDLPITRLAEEEFFNRAMAMSDSDIHFAIETLDGQHIGFSGIDRIDWRHGRGTTGTIIGPPEFRGRGLGPDAMRVRTRYAFDVLGLRMLVAEVMDGNEASHRALVKAGYREVARLPRWFWKRGAYRDRILLVVERQEAGGSRQEIRGKKRDAEGKSD